MNPFRLWVYLQTTPLFWLTATLAAFLVADALAKAAGRRPIVNHVLIAIALLGGLLKLTGTDYQTYFNGAQFVHFLLGPATVALGVPIYTNFALVRRNVWPLAAALLIGATVAIASAVLVAKAFGAPRAVLIALAPKSITAGVAMAVTEALGGAPPLTAVLVIATGILGAVIVTPSWTRSASPTTPRAASPWASPRMASAPRAPSRSIRSPACSPASPWDLTPSSPRR
jgi:putative effector of murein hydrolase